MSDWLAPLGVLILAGALGALVGEGNARRAVFICAALIAAVWALRRIAAPAADIAALADGSESQYVTPLIKGIGVAWAAWLASLALRELGSQSAASVAELVGAAELAAIAAPMVARLVSAALALV